MTSKRVVCVVPLQPSLGFAELSVIVNAAPTGGHVDASPRAGIAAVDTFYLESLGWTDDVEDLPLTFSFSYINGQVRSRTRSSVMPVI